MAEAASQQESLLAPASDEVAAGVPTVATVATAEAVAAVLPDGAPPAELADSDSVAGMRAALEHLHAAVADGFCRLSQQHGDTVALDHFKEDQIARLHDELQAYRTGLVHETARQVLRGLIRLHDDVGKVAKSLEQEPPTELTPQRFARQLAEIQDDIELLLGEHGVERFTAPGEAFDPRRQTALRTVATSRGGEAGRLAERLRPGFAQGEMLLQKERVAVYVASNSNQDQGKEGQS